MSQSDRAAQQLSQKLLQGWTMLAESCANPAMRCNVPLVENRKGDKRILCVGCSAEFKREDGDFVVSSRPNAVATAQATEPKPPVAPLAALRVPSPAPEGQVGDGEYDEFDIKPPTAAEARLIEARMKESQKHSADIGQKLLQGWTMMADSCAHRDCFLPLMRNPKNLDQVCVVHGIVSSVPTSARSQPSSIPSSALSPPPAPKVTPPAHPVIIPAPVPLPTLAPTVFPARDDIIRAKCRREFLDPTRPIPSEVDSLIAAANAMRTQLYQNGQQFDSETWAQRVVRMDQIDVLSHSTVEMCLQAERLRTFCAVPSNSLLAVQQATQELYNMAAVLAQKQGEASARLGSCTDQQESWMLTHFIGRVSLWLRRLRENQMS